MTYTRAGVRYDVDLSSPVIQLTNTVLGISMPVRKVLSACKSDEALMTLTYGHTYFLCMFVCPCPCFGVPVRVLLMLPLQCVKYLTSCLIPPVSCFTALFLYLFLARVQQQQLGVQHWRLAGMQRFPFPLFDVTVEECPTVPVSPSCHGRGDWGRPVLSCLTIPLPF
jgi:hypothetical protein